MRFRNQLAAAAAFTLLTVPVAFAQDPPAEEVEVVSVQDVTADHVGEEITVGGRVLDVRLITGSGLHISFMSSFLVIIPDSHRHLWKEVDPIKRYKGRDLQITGEVLEENEALFMGVTAPDQLKVVPRRRRRRS